MRISCELQRKLGKSNEQTHAILGLGLWILTAALPGV